MVYVYRHLYIFIKTYAGGGLWLYAGHPEVDTVRSRGTVRPGWLAALLPAPLMSLSGRHGGTRLALFPGM